MLIAQSTTPAEVEKLERQFERLDAMAANLGDEDRAEALMLADEPLYESNASSDSGACLSSRYPMFFVAEHCVMHDDGRDVLHVDS